jgi:protein-S-isoprenylcysteine O-methyltransferase Ste14
MLVGGIGLTAAGGLRLGSKLTPLPRPADGSVLVETGVFGVVRHPMYGGGIVAAFGWALFRRGWLTLGYAALLAVFADLKARREEAWLTARFPQYADYRRRVRRLIPFVY